MSNLDLIIKDLNKKMKVGNIQLGVDFQEVQKIPFSSCRLNYMTYGGIPVGRIAEFYGADGSGKTTTAIDDFVKAIVDRGLSSNDDKYCITSYDNYSKVINEIAEQLKEGGFNE